MFGTLKLLSLLLLASCLISTTLSLKRARHKWAKFAKCLQMRVQQNPSSAEDILLFIRRSGFMIVPGSNLLTSREKWLTLNIPRRDRREAGRTAAVYQSRNCPFKYQVKETLNVVPRFLAYATCDDCDSRCVPVMYTHQVLRRNCGHFWAWSEETLPVAYQWG